MGNGQNPWMSINLISLSIPKNIKIRLKVLNPLNLNQEKEGYDHKEIDH
jgi:hypothetical protein